MTDIVKELLSKLEGGMRASGQMAPLPPPPPAPLVTPDQHQQMLEQMIPNRVDPTQLPEGEFGMLDQFLGKVKGKEIKGTGGKVNPLAKWRSKYLPESVNDALTMTADFVGDPLGAYRDDIQEAGATIARHQNMNPLVGDLAAGMITELPRMTDDDGLPNVDLAGAGLAGYLKRVGKGGAKTAAKAPPIELDATGKFIEGAVDKLELARRWDRELYEEARRFSGAAKRGEVVVDEFGDALSPMKAQSVWQNVKDFWDKVTTGQDRVDLAGRWMLHDRLQEAALLTKDPDAVMKAGQNKAAIEAALGKEGVKSVRAARNNITAKFNELLDEAVESGLVSKARAKAAKEKNLRYVPLHVLATDAAGELTKTAEEIGHVFKSSTINPNTDWFKHLKGAGDPDRIKNPLESIAERVAPEVMAIEKQKVLKVLTELPKKNDAFKELVVPLETAEVRAARVIWGQEIVKKQAEIGWLAGGLKKLNRSADRQLDRYIKVQTDMAKFGSELSDLDFPFARMKDIRPIVDKIKRRQASLLVKGRKLQGNQDTADAFIKEIWKSEAELKAAREELKQLSKAPLPEGFAEVKYFRDGIAETWAIPKAMKATLSSMNKQQVDIITSTAKKAAQAFRASTTSMNPVFMIKNTLRDFPVMATRSQTGMHLGNAVQSWLSGFWSAVKKDEFYKGYMKDGGGMATFSEVVRANPTMKGKTGWGSTAGRVVTNPKEWFETLVSPVTRANELLELSPRLAEYKRGVKQGMASKDAAFLGRDLTVDFMKSGDYMALANMWVPFLNASTQGQLNTITTIGKGFGSPLQNKQTFINLTTIIGMPAAATYYLNTKNFPEVWDDIRDFEKDQYHIIIYGNGKDENGQYNQVIKIPKDHISKVLTGPLLESLDYARRNDPDALEKTLGSIVEGVSPLSRTMPEDKRFNPGEIGVNVATSVLPPLAKGIAETAQNRNLYTKLPIEPPGMEDQKYTERYYRGGNRRTPKPYVWASPYVGLSPLKLENFIKTSFGPLPGQIIEPTSSNMKNQLLRSFRGAYGDAVDERIAKKVIERGQERGSERFNTIERWIEEGNKEEMRKWARRQDDPEAAAKYIVRKLKQKDQKASGATALDYALAQQPAAERNEEISRLFSGISPEKRAEYLERWKANGKVPKTIIRKLEQEWEIE